MAADSVTATYAAVRLYIDNWRWQGVPFYLRTGKAIPEKVIEVIMQFRHPPHMMFSVGGGRDPAPNMMALCLQPDEGLHLKFGVKVPDEGMSTQSVDMEFHYDSAFKDQEIPEAYERLLQDALEGDASLFIRNDHIEEAWRIVDSLLRSDPAPLYVYERGSWGPEAADRLLARDGRGWQRGCGGHDDH